MLGNHRRHCPWKPIMLNSAIFNEKERFLGWLSLNFSSAFIHEEGQLEQFWRIVLVSQTQGLKERKSLSETLTIVWGGKISCQNCPQTRTQGLKRRKISLWAAIIWRYLPLSWDSLQWGHFWSHLYKTGLQKCLSEWYSIVVWRLCRALVKIFQITT